MVPGDLWWVAGRLSRAEEMQAHDSDSDSDSDSDAHHAAASCGTQPYNHKHTHAHPHAKASILTEPRMLMRGGGRNRHLFTAAQKVALMRLIAESNGPGGVVRGVAVAACQRYASKIADEAGMIDKAEVLEAAVKFVDNHYKTAEMRQMLARQVARNAAHLRVALSQALVGASDGDSNDDSDDDAGGCQSSHRHRH